MNASNSFRVCRVVTTLAVALLCIHADFVRAWGESPTADRVTLVVLAPEGPIFVDARISIGDSSYREWVADFLADKLDGNGDDQLSETELDAIPVRLKGRTGIQSTTAMMKQIGGEENVELIGSEEFAKWFSDRLGRDFEVIAEPVPSSDAVRLAPLVDLNDDGRIDRMELAEGMRQLRFRDLDDDQTFSAAELMPFRDPRNQQAAVVPDVADLPFMQLTDDESVSRIVDRIVNRYGSESGIDVKLFRLPDGLTSRRNWSTHINSEQLREFLKSPDFHIRLEILLSDRSSASRIQSKVEPYARQYCRLDQTRRDRLKMIIDDMPLEIRSRGGGAQNRTYLVGFLGQYFTISDADKNQYLEESEFSGLAGQLAQAQIAADFNAADLDGDEQVTRAELRSYVERDAIATQSRIEVSVRQDGKTLFKLLDQNTDRRLTVREFQDGFPALLEYDLNQDGLLAESELGTSYVLQIGLGQPEALRGGPASTNMMMQSADAVLPGTTGLSGPEWFRRMDRNQDGDVSIREFLGKRETFEQIDLDKDGLLSADEAEQIIAE